MSINYKTRKKALDFKTDLIFVWKKRETYLEKKDHQITM